MAEGDNNIVRFAELRKYDEKIKEYINTKIQAASSSASQQTEAPDNSTAINALFI